MTADRSPDATADDAAVAGSGHLTDADREALIAAVGGHNPRTQILVRATVEAIVARAVNEALTEAADAIESEVDWSGGRNNYGDNGGYEHAARMIRARRT